jgi:hypothetical protein
VRKFACAQPRRAETLSSWPLQQAGELAGELAADAQHNVMRHPRKSWQPWDTMEHPTNSEPASWPAVTFLSRVPPPYCIFQEMRRCQGASNV